MRQKVNHSIHTTTEETESLLAKLAELENKLQQQEALIQELKKSNDLLQAVSDCSPNYISIQKSIRNADGKIVDFELAPINQSAKSYLENYDIKGKAYSVLFPAIVPAGLLEKMKETVETGIPQNFILQDQQESPNLWFQFTLSKLNDGVVSHVSDITVRKKAELEVLRLKDDMTQQATDKYRLLFESMDAGFCICEAVYDEQGVINDCRYLELNPSVERHTNIKTDQMLGKLRSEVFHTKPGDWWIQTITKVMTTQKQQRLEQYIPEVKKWIDINIYPYGENRFAIVYDDITQRKHAEEKLRTNEERQAFLLQLSDTLRTLSDPMDIQKAAAQLLGEKLTADWVYYMEFNDDLSIATIYQEYKRNENISLIGKHPTREIPRLLSSMKEGIPFLVNDLSTSPGINKKAREFYSSLGIKAVAIVPIVKKEQTIAAIAAVFCDIHEWSPTELNIMQETTQRTWEAVERARTVTTLRKRENELAQVHRIGGIAGVDIEIPYGTDDYISKPSPEYILIHGLSQDTIQESFEDWAQRIHPDDRERATSALRNALNGDVFTYQSEYRIVRPGDGQVRWIYARKDIQRTKEGKPIHLTGAHIDITERKAVEEALRQSEEKYLIKLEQEVEERTAELKESNHLVHRITETMPDMVSIMKWPSLELTYTNHFPFTEQGFDSNIMHKMPREERVKYIHPDDLPILDQYFKHFSTLEDGDLNLCDYRAVNDRNEWMWFRVRGKVFERDNAQHAVSIINVIQNISDLKAAEERVKEQFHFVNQIAVTIPDMLTVMEVDSFKILYANSKPFLENGYSYEWIANSSMEQRNQLIHPDDVQAVRSYFQKFKSYSDDEIQSLEYRAKPHVGKWLWYRVRGKIFKRDEAGVPIQCVNIVQNINALKEAEKELLEMQLHGQKEILNAIIHTQEQERERIGEALHNGVAQLLYGIQTRLQLLETSAESEKNKIREIQTILADAIKDVRGISFELVPSVLMDHGVETALRSLIQKVVTEKLQVHLTCNFKERLPEKIEFPIYRMMQELLNNILKHSCATETIMKISKTKNHLSILVKDNGIGFNQKEIKGMHKGIGLQSVKNRIRLLDGTLKIKSAPGKGTVVNIQLPI